MGLNSIKRDTLIINHCLIEEDVIRSYRDMGCFSFNDGVLSLTAQIQKTHFAELDVTHRVVQLKIDARL